MPEEYIEYKVLVKLLKDHPRISTFALLELVKRLTWIADIDKIFYKDKDKNLQSLTAEQRREVLVIYRKLNADDTTDTNTLKDAINIVLNKQD